MHVMEDEDYLAPEASTGEIWYMGQLSLRLLHGRIHKPKSSLDLPLAFLLRLAEVKRWCVDNGPAFPALRRVCCLRLFLSPAFQHCSHFA